MLAWCTWRAGGLDYPTLCARLAGWKTLAKFDDIVHPTYHIANDGDGEDTKWKRAYREGDYEFLGVDRDYLQRITQPIFEREGLTYDWWT